MADLYYRKEENLNRLLQDVFEKDPQDDPLCRFLERGSVPMDNGNTERKAKSLAIGRGNWMFCTIDMSDTERSEDLLGRTYEYCIAQFAEKEGVGGGEFHAVQCGKNSCIYPPPI